MDIEKLIIGATGIGYFLVGVLQLKKGSISNTIIWFGYSFSQIGLWMALK